MIVDATVDGSPPGSLKRLEPRFASDYPPALTAHDIGLKDMLEAFYLLGTPPEVVLLTVSIEMPRELSTELSPGLAARLPELQRRVREEIEQLAGAPAS